MKILKRIFIGVLCLPFILIGAFILFEIFGFAVNHVSTDIQTVRLKKSLLNELSEVKIVDIYSETGNTGPTGNHVDMLSVVIFKTDDTKADIENKLKDVYNLDDEWSCWIEDMATIKKHHDENKYIFSFCDKMQIPDDTENCYMIYLNNSAPFVDNIEGH